MQSVANRRSSTRSSGKTAWTPRGVEALRRHVEPLPHRERRLERRHVALLGDEEQVADLAEMRIDAHLLLEALDARQRAQRQPHVDLRRELETNAARVARRRAAAEVVALEHDDVAHTARGKVVRDGRTDDPASDDDDVSALHAGGDVLLGLLRRNGRRSDAHHREHGFVQLEVVA